MNLKRLWDTENKKTVRAIPTWDPHKKFQVWTDDDGSHLYVYANSKYEELNTANAAVSEYWPTVWKTLNDETVGYYLTNEPTDLYNWDEGDDVTYTFKDWDGTVLKTGKLEEGETPTPPADPTRAATAQYTYTFAGWNPTVWPISKKTTYTATYTATVNKYTITATSSDADLWTVSPASVANVEYGTALTVADNVITVGTGTSAPTITATAGEGWEFVSWWTVPATVTGNTSVEAEFQGVSTDVTVTFVSDPAEAGYVMGYERDEEQEDDVETVITSATFPSWINLSVVVWQDTSIQFDDLIEDRHTEYYPVPNGSNTFVGVFIGETEVTDQAIELTEDTTLTVKFQENSR